MNFEKVLCEVIDNCIDNPVANQKVEVDVIIEEEIAKSIQNDSFRIYIYDRANGFESEDNSMLLLNSHTQKVNLVIAKQLVNFSME